MAEEGLQLEESDEEMEVKTRNSKKADFIYVPFSDMPALNEKQLDLVYHKPKYQSGINVYSESFKKLQLKQKVLLIYNYHSDLSRRLAALARSSLRFAPKPKDIPLLVGVPNDLSDFEVSTNSELPDDVTYRSRAGRQIKRKKYTEDIDLFDENIFHSKKTKNTEEDKTWETKNSKSIGRKQLPEEKSSLEVNSENNNNINDDILKPIEEFLESYDTNKFDNKKVVAEKTPDSVKRRSVKKLTNAEILSRSSLFNPSPRRTRSEMLFDNLKDEKAKQEQKENVADKFERTLKVADEDNFDEECILNEENDEPFVRRRIIPPSLPPSLRKASTSRKGISENLQSEAENKGIREYARKTTKVPNVAPSTVQKLRNKLLEGAESSRKQSTGIKNITCPICNELFSEKEVENHAATCGEVEPVLRAYSPPATRSSQVQEKLICEICDKEFLLNYTYEVHVKECIAAQKRLK